MGRDFVEAFLKLRAADRAGHVKAWFEQQGLTVLPIQAGLLLSGSSDAFDRVFGLDVGSLPRPARLDLPGPLAGDVELIEIPRPRYPMSGP